MAAEPLPLPDDIRRDVRARSYGNRAAEVEAIGTVDDAVWAKTRAHEAYLARTARDLDTHAGEQLAQGSDLLHSVAELTQRAEQGLPVDQSAAKAYQDRRALAMATIGRLRELRGRVEFTAKKAADPYKSMSEVLAKYAGLRAGRAWTTH